MDSNFVLFTLPKRHFDGKRNMEAGDRGIRGSGAQKEHIEERHPDAWVLPHPHGQAMRHASGSPFSYWKYISRNQNAEQARRTSDIGPAECLSPFFPHTAILSDTQFFTRL